MARQAVACGTPAARNAPGILTDTFANLCDALARVLPVAAAHTTLEHVHMHLQTAPEEDPPPHALHTLLLAMADIHIAVLELIRLHSTTSSTLHTPASPFLCPLHDWTLHTDLNPPRQHSVMRYAAPSKHSSIAGRLAASKAVVNPALVVQDNLTCREIKMVSPGHLLQLGHALPY